MKTITTSTANCKANPINSLCPECNTPLEQHCHKRGCSRRRPDDAGLPPNHVKCTDCGEEVHKDSDTFPLCVECYMDAYEGRMQMMDMHDWDD